MFKQHGLNKLTVAKLEQMHGQMERMCGKIELRDQNSIWACPKLKQDPRAKFMLGCYFGHFLRQDTCVAKCTSILAMRGNKIIPIANHIFYRGKSFGLERLLTTVAKMPVAKIIPYTISKLQLHLKTPIAHICPPPFLHPDFDSQ